MPEHKACTECGATIRYGAKKVCSAECNRERARRYEREKWERNGEKILEAARAKTLARRKQRPPVTCGECGSTFCYFGKGGSLKKFCDPCAYQRQLRMARGARFTSDSKRCVDPACDRYATSRGMCPMHHRRWLKANGLWKPSPSDGWTEARKAHDARRKALKRGASSAQKFSRGEIFERDGYLCMLCWTPLDMEATFPSPKYPTIDHIVPLARGGSHTPDNVQAACFRCNVRKSDRVDWTLADVLRDSA